MAEPRSLLPHAVCAGQFVHIEEPASSLNEASEHYLGTVLPSPERHIGIDDLIRNEGRITLPAWLGLRITLIKEADHG